MKLYAYENNEGDKGKFRIINFSVLSLGNII